jgi:hypothetical protein
MLRHQWTKVSEQTSRSDHESTMLGRPDSVASQFPRPSSLGGVAYEPVAAFVPGRRELLA